MEKSTIYKRNNFFKNDIPVYLNIACVGSGHPCEFHRHDFIEIAYVNAGHGLHQVGNAQYAVSKGSLTIINTNIPHAFICNAEAGEMEIFNCVFIPEFIDFSLLNTNDFKDVAASILFNSFFIEDGPVINLQLKGSQQLEIEELYRKMQQEFFTAPKGYVNVIRSLLIETLTKIFRFLEAENVQDNKIISRKTEIVNEAVSFLKLNYSSSQLNINEVALRTFLSPSYLSRLFKENTGSSFSEYLQNIRISEACSLLKKTDAKIIDIMQEVGFRDIKHFNRLFKKVTGKTPGQYRKE